MDRRKMLPHKPPGAIPKPSGSQFPEVTIETPMPPVKVPAPTKTLRDEFAMAALSGMASKEGCFDYEYEAMVAYKYADAMLKARERK